MRHFLDIKRMVFVSDTHGLIRAVLERELEGAGLILHAGDVGSPAVLTWLGKFAPTVAVRGNVDGTGLKLPETEVVSVNGQWIYVLHQLERLDLAPAAAGFRMVISGHSHQASVRQKDGVWFCNPGSIGPRRFRL
ncbi:MAG: metallophosphoesterase family protein, partial [Verrucomicrobia bacterium]|nr:metallophosphoesterase family protein [Verrucomicrobiota bacterium]